MDTHKKYLVGTHRVRTPEQTWERLLPVLGQVGVTRVADVTWLDDIGIPVFQAIRPNARMLSVSQGKGVTPMAARVSAAMESIEMWHAENLADQPETAGEPTSVRDVAGGLGYQLTELLCAPRHHLNPGVRLRWCRATRLDGSGETLVPLDCLRLDSDVDDRWNPPLFEPTSNGLASGNTYAEAVAHGLYELIERDALAGPGEDRRPIAIDADWGETVGGLLERFRAARVQVRVDLMPSIVGVPCFVAHIWSEDYAVAFEGAGCHLDRDVAISRAMTEAAQSRLTAIGGTREDVRGRVYAAGTVRPGAAAPCPPAHPDDIPSRCVETVEEEVRLLAERIVAAVGRAPMAVDHTRPDLEIPVVRVLSPGLRYPPGY